MTYTSFLHVNTNREVIVTREQVFAIQYSDAHKATHLISIAGAIIPVKETVDEARIKIYGSTTQPMSMEDNKHGT